MANLDNRSKTEERVLFFEDMSYFESKVTAILDTVNYETGITFDIVTLVEEDFPILTFEVRESDDPGMVGETTLLKSSLRPINTDLYELSAGVYGIKITGDTPFYPTQLPSLQVVQGKRYIRGYLESETAISQWLAISIMVRLSPNILPDVNV